jgi:hypothetical protein
MRRRMQGCSLAGTHDAYTAAISFRHLIPCAASRPAGLCMPVWTAGRDCTISGSTGVFSTQTAAHVPRQSRAGAVASRHVPPARFMAGKTMRTDPARPTALPSPLTSCRPAAGSLTVASIAGVLILAPEAHLSALAVCHSYKALPCCMWK